MRILAFYPYLPWPLDRGAHYRGFYLLRELARVHQVDLLALAEQGEASEHIPRFAEFCHRVELVSFQHPDWQKLFPGRLLNALPSTVAHWTLPQAAGALGRMLATERYDVVHVFDIVLAQYLLRTHKLLPLVLDRTRVDLQYQLMEAERLRPNWKRRILNWENLSKLFIYEKRVAQRARLQITCGPDDADFLHGHVRRGLDVAIIPNGVDPTYFTPDGTASETRASRPTVLFCGAMDYNPNLDALRWYFAEIHDALKKRVPEFQVLLVGKNPPAEVKAYADRPEVRVTGAVPDVRPYYRQAWLQMVPLRIGGGTRLKIVESMAMGTPVVSTAIGAQGLGLRHEHDFLQADSAQELVAQTARALCDPELRERLTDAGLATVRSRLAWPSLGQQLCVVYAERFGQPLRGIHREAASAQSVVTPGSV